MEDAIERGMAELRGLEGSGPGGEKEQRVTPGECDADSGVDESTQALEQGEGVELRARPQTSRIPRKTPPDSPMKKPNLEKRSSISQDKVRAHQGRAQQAGEGRRMPRSKSVPKPFSSVSLSVPEPTKKVSMNKVVVGYAPSPNLMKVQSRIGSLSNTDHKAGGGNVKIESRKLEWEAKPRTKMFNENYAGPQGGDKKIETRRLTWNATSKIGSLGEHRKHKPGGGDKKIESRKLDWSATSKIGSTKNMKHKAGGGNVKIHDEKLEVVGQSRIGSLANMRHKAGGGEKKIFDDKEYSRQMRDFQSSGPQTPALSSARGSTHGSLGSNIHQSPEPHPIDEQF